MRRVAIAIALAVLVGVAIRVLRQTDADQSERFRADAWQLPNETLLGFIEVESGSFVMGSDRQQDRLASDDEEPRHELALPAFFIGRYEVTIGQYKTCVRDSGCSRRDPHALEGPDDFPVRYVSWHDAMAYGAWLERRLTDWSETPKPLRDALAGHRDGRRWHVVLLSEAEWERAARGVDGRTYPWGNDIDGTKANYAESKHAAPMSVGAFPAGASPIGSLDMSGNVTEWTRSHYTKGYPYDANDGREDVKAGDLPDRVIRGGSFSNSAIGVRAAARDGADTPEGFGFIGFRVAISPTGP